MPNKPNPHGSTQGPLHAVPCPHCQQKLDFRAHADSEMGGAGWGDQGLERGATIECEHCSRKSKILDVQKVIMIKLVRA